MDRIVLLGDLNIDMLDLSRPCTKFFTNLLESLGLVQLVREPTRVTDNSSSLIDHIIIDKCLNPFAGVIDTSAILDSRGRRMTDHKLIYCELPNLKTKKKIKYISYRDYKNFDMTVFIELLSEVNWDSVISSYDVNYIADFVMDSITLVFDKCAPVVRKRVTRKRSPWIDNDIKNLIKQKNKLRDLQKSCPAAKESYIKCRNELNSVIRRAKKEYLAQNLDCKNSMKFWSTLTKSGVLETKNGDSSCPFSPNELNVYFASMGAGGSIDKDRLAYYEGGYYGAVEKGFRFSAVGKEKVMEVMNKITSKAFGTDGLSIDMMKCVSPYCLPTITHLINVSLSTGVFPDRWKRSIVIPLPKCSNPTVIRHFRPISILPACSKILEKIVVEQLVDYLESSNILPESQSGFRRGFSTCSALLNMCDELLQAKDQGQNCIMASLDYSQAFDSVRHGMLISKLKFLNFNDVSLRWFSSYLCHRSQVARVNGRCSNVLLRDVGVPQGTCLGPILFIIYTCDLVSVLKSSTLHSYADDCQLVLSYDSSKFQEAIELMNSDLLRVKQWSDCHALDLNPDKCTVLHFGSSSTPPSNSLVGEVKLGDNVLSVSDSVKVLGIKVDSKLNFRSHVSFICQKVFNRLRIFHRLKSLMSESAKLELVKSKIFPIIHYALPLFNECLTLSSRLILMRLQNRALRFVFNLKKFDHISMYRDRAKVISVDRQCFLQTVKIVHKTLSSNVPPYLKRKLVPRAAVRKRCTRQDAMLELPRVRLELGKKGFSYFGPRAYNTLPGNIKALSYSSFKAKLKLLP